jgi:hypothetical protein
MALSFATDIAIPFVGGLLIALVFTLNFLLKGRITSVTQIIGKVVRWEKDNLRWTTSFLAGLIVLPVVAYDIFGFGEMDGVTVFDPVNVFVHGLNVWGWMLAGFLIGFGSRVAGEHGDPFICLYRFSQSRLWTTIFVFVGAIAMATVRYNNEFWDNTVWEDASEHMNIYIFGNLFGLFGLFVVGWNLWRNQIGIIGTIDILLSFALGALLALGFLVAGFCRRSVVLGFLTLDGNWDPSILVALITAVGLSFIAYRVIKKKSHPTLALAFDDQDEKEEWDWWKDWRRPFGGLIFGAGWGLGGLVISVSLTVAPLYLPQVILFFLPVVWLGQWIADLIFPVDNQHVGYTSI